MRWLIIFWRCFVVDASSVVSRVSKHTDSLVTLCSNHFFFRVKRTNLRAKMKMVIFILLSSLLLLMLSIELQWVQIRNSFSYHRLSTLMQFHMFLLSLFFSLRYFRPFSSFTLFTFRCTQIHWTIIWCFFSHFAPYKMFTINTDQLIVLMLDILLPLSLSRFNHFLSYVCAIVILMPVFIYFWFACLRDKDGSASGNPADVLLLFLWVIYFFK